MADVSVWCSESEYVRVTQAYGSTEMGSPHRGMDWNTNVGGVHYDMTVRAQGNGMVLRSEKGTGGNASWGEFIVIQYDDKGVSILTAHHGSRYVHVGDTVTYGTPIGTYDSTGNVTGPHCHEEWHQNVWHDPVYNPDGTIKVPGYWQTGITNQLTTPQNGLPNSKGLYTNAYAGTGEYVPPDPTPPDQPDNPLTPDDPSRPGQPTTYINLSLVEFTESGHFITACCSNDPDGYVYFNNKRFFRAKYPDFTTVEEYVGDYKRPFNIWTPVNDVHVVKYLNKNFSYLPDAITV